MAKQLVFTDEARTTLKQGIDAIADAVKTTLGVGTSSRSGLPSLRWVNAQGRFTNKIEG